MNQKRRKEIAEIEGILQEQLAALEMLRDEEQEAFDNLPDGLQNSEKGEASQEAIDSLESCISNMESAIDDLGNFEA